MKRGPKIEQGNSLGSAARLEELESRRDGLMKWMKLDSTPDDVRILDDLNRQIQVMKEQSGIQE